MQNSSDDINIPHNTIITQSLAALRPTIATISITQRPITVKNADLIVVLDHGKIVEKETHQQLIAQNNANSWKCSKSRFKLY